MAFLLPQFVLFSNFFESRLVFMYCCCFVHIAKVLVESKKKHYYTLLFFEMRLSTSPKIPVRLLIRAYNNYFYKGVELVDG